jgi:hypothetical protein
MTEIWKEIKGYEGYFEVSNLGNFRSKDRMVKYKQSGMRLYPGKSLKTETIVDGYQRIVLMKEAHKKRYMCHRLVAETFIPNPEDKPYVNHINGIKSDNRACNLEWVTQSENELHSFRILGNNMRGKTYPKKVKCVDLDMTFNSMSDCIKFLKTGCIEGLKKAINAIRLYHGHTFIYQ